MVLWLVALAAIVIGTIFAGYFSGFETGLYTLNRVRLRHRREQGDPQAQVLSLVLQRPSRAIATTLVGHNLCVYVVTAITTKLYEGVWPDWAEVASVLTLALPLFLLAEVIPKEVTRRAADSLPYRLALGFRLAERLFRPATAALERVARLCGRLVGARGSGAGWSEIPRLRYYLALGRRVGVLSSEQTEMADNILRLGRRVVADCMVPLVQVEALSEEASEEEALSYLRGCRHRRVLVYRGRRAEVTGVVHGLELLMSPRREWPERRAGVTRPLARLTGSTPVLEALDRLRRRELALAVVEGGRGEVVGLVSIQDLVEEIVGQLRGPDGSDGQVGGAGGSGTKK